MNIVPLRKSETRKVTVKKTFYYEHGRESQAIALETSSTS